VNDKRTELREMKAVLIACLAAASVGAVDVVKVAAFSFVTQTFVLTFGNSACISRGGGQKRGRNACVGYVYDKVSMWGRWSASILLFYPDFLVCLLCMQLNLGVYQKEKSRTIQTEASISCLRFSDQCGQSLAPSRPLALLCLSLPILSRFLSFCALVLPAPTALLSILSFLSLSVSTPHQNISN